MGPVQNGPHCGPFWIKQIKLSHSSKFSYIIMFSIIMHKGTGVNVNTKMYKKGNLFMNKKRNEIVHLI